MEDPAWLGRWDVAFAELYLQALDTWRDDPAAVPGPWREAFSAPADLEPYLHVLLGMNAHINYDMPQSLLQVVGEADRHDPALMASRARDHHALDGVIVALVPQESRHLVKAAAAAPGVLDRLLLPLSRAASAKLLRESREQVWANTDVLLRARAAGPAALAAATARLEELSTRRVHDLLGAPAPALPPGPPRLRCPARRGRAAGRLSRGGGPGRRRGRATRGALAPSADNGRPGVGPGT